MSQKPSEEFELSEESRFKNTVDYLPALHGAWALQATIEWCRGRRKNSKKNTAPPPNNRILEARLTDALRRKANLIANNRALQRKTVPGTSVSLASLKESSLFSPEMYQRLLGALSDTQRALLSNPQADEHLCDDTVDAVVARIVRNKQGLSAPELRDKASALGWALASPTQYADFYRQEILPTLSRMGGPILRCPECCVAFSPKNKRQRYCSNTCSARYRNRGRQKVGKGRSAMETTKKRAEDQLQRHWNSCKLCLSGKPCARREAFLQADDALSHISYRIAPEDAVELQASSGRKRKRRVD
jgi:hypothetical protein